MAEGRGRVRASLCGVRSFISFGCLLSVICCLAGCTTLNPATGRQEMVIFSTPAEVAMGQDVQAQMAASLKFSKDEAAVARLERIGRRVAQVSDRQDYVYSFYLVEKEELNAFTTPGGHIYFYTGLLKGLPSDDEVAAVLAHEIGHCAARHVVKKYQMALGYNFLTQVVFGNVEQTLAIRLARIGADAITSIGMSAYSRQDEYQADRLGVKYMYLAGYRPEAMVTTFEILAKDSKGDDNDWLLLRSHPRLSDRIDVVKKEIELVRSQY